MDYGDDQVSFNLNNGFKLSAAIDSLTSAYNIALDTDIHDTVTSAPWGGDTWTTVAGSSSGVWVHWAIVRASGIMTMFINGVKSPTSRPWMNASATPSIIAFGRTASASGGQANGGVDDVRVTAGIALYTASFTPPTASYPNPGPPPGYIVYRDGVEIGQVTTLNSTTFLDLQVVPGQTYSYTVAAQDGSDNPQSDPSAALLVTVPFAPQTVFGGFAAAEAFPPIQLANLAGIKPRVYVPIENNTVRTKQ